MPDESTTLILDRLAALDKKVDVFISAQHEICRAAAQQRCEHRASLYSAEGVVTRLQTVESRMALVWLVWIGVAAFLTNVGKSAWDLISQK